MENNNDNDKRDEIEKRFDKIKELAKINDYEGTIKICDDLLELKEYLTNEELADVYYNKAVAYCKLKDYQNAIDNCNIGIIVNPNDADIYSIRGFTYHYLNDYQKAIDDFNKAISINHNDSDIYFKRGYIYFKLKDYQKTLDDYSKAILIDPKDASLYNSRGATYGNLKDYQKALEDFSKAIEINPNHVNAYYNKGRLHKKLKEYDKAIDDYNKAIELNLNYADAYNGRGIVYFNLQQYDKAFEDYKKALENIDDDEDLKQALQDNLLELINYLDFDTVFEVYKEYFYRESDNLTKIEALSLYFQKQIKGNIKEINPNGGYIYQYTTKESIEKFAENPKIRLSPSSMLNDPKEGMVLLEYLKNNIHNLDKKDKTYNKLVNIESLLKIKRPAFIRSLSLNHDSLQMWGMYTKNKEGIPDGVSIGYPISLFEKSNMSVKNYSIRSGNSLDNSLDGLSNDSTPDTALSFDKMYFSQVVYLKKGNSIQDAFGDHLKKPELMNDYIKLIYDELENIDPDLPNYDAKIETLYVTLMPLLHLVKKDDYDYEQEYRLVYLPKDSYNDKRIDAKSGCIESDILIMPKGTKLQVVGSPMLPKKDFEKIKYMLLNTKTCRHLFDAKNFRDSEVDYR